MDVFDKIIEGLEQRGAFNDVPVPDGVVLPSDFKSLKPAGNMPFSIKAMIFHYEEHVPQGVSKYQFDNYRAALAAYMPQDVLMPWLKTYTQEAMRKPLSPIAKRLLATHLKSIHGNIEYIKKGDKAMATHPGMEADLDDAQKETAHELEIAFKIQERHPGFTVAMTIFQTAHLDFLCALAERLRDTSALSAEQKKIAAWSLQVLSTVFSTENFMSPTIQIANAYHQRVGGNYSKPMQAEDFVKGWETLYHGRGFHSRMSNLDGTPVVSRCPFKSQGTQASAQMAGNEIVTTNRTTIRATMGYGAWCLYSLATKDRISAVIRFVQVRRLIRTIRRNGDDTNVYTRDRPYETRMHSIVGSIHGKLRF